MFKWFASYKTMYVIGACNWIWCLWLVVGASLGTLPWVLTLILFLLNGTVGWFAFKSAKQEKARLNV